MGSDKNPKVSPFSFIMIIYSNESIHTVDLNLKQCSNCPNVDKQFSYKRSYFEFENLVSCKRSYFELKNLIGCTTHTDTSSSAHNRICSTYRYVLYLKLRVRSTRKIVPHTYCTVPEVFDP